MIACLAALQAEALEGNAELLEQNLREG